MKNEMHNYVLNEDTKQEFIDAINTIVNTGVDFKLRKNSLNSLSKDELIKLISEKKIMDEGTDLDCVLKDYEEIAEYSLNFGSPWFMAQPDNGLTMAGMLGDIGKSFLQQNMVNYEYSPIATILEITLLNELRKLVGYETVENKEYLAAKVGGAFVMGGYNANLSCLLIAREKLKQKLKEQNRRFNPRKTRVLAAVPYAHYSLRRSLDILGLGNKDLSEEERSEGGYDYEAVYSVETDGYAMDVRDLEKKILELRERDEDIMAIYAIAGESRAMGFDHLNSILEIAKKYNIWVHVDACQGGQCLFNKELKKELLSGIELCDSISLDPHKGLMLPYNLSTFFVKNTDDIYLLPKGATVISNDDDSLGKFTPGIGSKNFMSLKLWMMLRNVGWNNLSAEMMRRKQIAMETADYASTRKDIIVLNPKPAFNAVMLMYWPAEREFNLKECNAVNKYIHEKLNENGRFFLHSFPCREDLGIIPEGNKPTVYPLRFMFGNPITTIDDIKLCINEISQIGNEYFIHGR